MVYGFAHGPEENSYTDTSAEREGKPLPERELGFGIFATKPDVSDGREGNPYGKHDDNDAQGDFQPSEVHMNPFHGCAQDGCEAFTVR